MALFDRPSQPAGSKQGTVPSFVRAIFVWPWKMVSVSFRYLFYQPMDEKIKTWTLRFPAKENPNMDKVLFDWPIVLQYDVKAKNRLISRKFSGMKFFHLIVRLTNQKPRSFVSVPYTNQIALFAFVGCFCFVRAFSFQGHTKIALNKVIVKQDTWAVIILCCIALRPHENHTWWDFRSHTIRIVTLLKIQRRDGNENVA